MKQNIFQKFKWALVLAVLLVISLAIFALSPFFLYDPRHDVVFLNEAARSAFDSQDFPAALEISETALKTAPDSFDLLMLAAVSSLELGKIEGSRKYFAAAAKLPNQSAEVVDNLKSIGLGLRSRGKLELAESAFRQAHAMDPKNIDVGEQLGLVLAQVGCRWEAANIYRGLLNQEVFSYDTLIFLANPEIVIDKEKELKSLSIIASKDTLVQLGNAYFDYKRGDMRSALAVLRTVVRARPDLVSSQVLLGKCMLVVEPESLAEWESNLPSQANLHPEIWFVRYLWAKQLKKSDASVHCLLQSLLLDEGSVAGTMELSQAIANRGDSAKGTLLAKKSLELDKLNGHANWLNEVREDIDRQREIADLTARLGRWSESVAWCTMMRANHPELDWVESLRRKVMVEWKAEKATPSKPRKDVQGLLLADFPMESLIPILRSKTESPAGILAHGSQQVRFEEQTKKLGIDFEYFPGRAGPVPGRKMQEVGGGGIGILDFDRDGWPDIYLAQGSDWPPPKTASEMRDPGMIDRLFRNRFGEVDKAEVDEDNVGSFSDVTSASGIVEFHFGQGVSVGDINSDGFDDIYVSNIGPNTLWINQGDGTFVDRSDWIPEQSEWTSSAAIADLNRDGMADIFDANYVKGEKVYELLCESGGKPTACGPNTFEQSPDRLLVNSGSGPMLDSSASTLAKVAAGNGLGVTVFRLEGEKDLAVYVSNDANPNVLLELAKDDTNPFGFEMLDSAIIRGVALDGMGRAEASMGIAVGDAQGDGRLDLFVTNVFHEHFTLYAQQEGGYFSDETAAMGLMEPTYDLLGFGTQFLDVQLDGFPDLLAINGDIDDLTDSGRTFRIRPALFENQSNRGFRLMPKDNLGEYFETPQVGRSLALLDFDRDGRMDFVSTCLEGKAAIVRNVTESANHFLTIQLIAKNTERTAIGAIVELRAGSQKWVQQLTAGNGYMVSNQRCLHFGIGDTRFIDEIKISWPSGLVELRSTIKCDAELLFVEP